MIERIKYGGIDNPFNYSEFTCDTILDLNNLPTNKEKGINNLETCSIGSKAIVIENRSQYILNGRNQWVLLKDYKNFGGGSNLEIDETLTLSGYAADAKSVGDKINIINETLDNTKEEVTQARVDANGTIYETLKERLDSTDKNVEKIESVSTELKNDLSNGNVGDGTISEKKTTFFERLSSNLIEKYPVYNKEGFSIDVDDNCIYTINGTPSETIKITLLEKVEDGAYVILSDNHNYNGKYFSITFSVPVINIYENKSERSLLTTMTNTIKRKEVYAIASNIISSGDTINGDMRIICTFTKGMTYDNFKTRFWIVKVGDNEDFSFNDYSLKNYYNKSVVDTKLASIKNEIKLSSNSTLRFGVVTDIHADNDDTEKTGLNGDEKIQLMVDAINEEHRKKALDWLFITGDINDNLGRKGGTLAFMKKYAFQLQMPVILFPGNHDPHNDIWLHETGGELYANHSLETEDFYFIWLDNFGENYGKTWLSHYSVYYADGDTAYVPCKSTDDGALLIGTDIDADTVQSNIMKGWTLEAVDGNYCKLMDVKDADMYKAPSLDFVKSEVEKAGDKYIILLTHQILSTTDGDTEGVMEYLNALPNYLETIEGHAHIFYFNKNTGTGKWKLNAGHFHVPSGGWDKVASNNYRGFCTVEIENNQLVAYKIQPTQNVGSKYEHEYDKLGPYVMAEVIKNKRATVDLTKVNKNREYSLKFANLD